MLIDDLTFDTLEVNMVYVTCSANNMMLINDKGIKLKVISRNLMDKINPFLSTWCQSNLRRFHRRILS